MYGTYVRIVEVDFQKYYMRQLVIIRFIPDFFSHLQDVQKQVFVIGYYPFIDILHFP